MTVRQFIQSLGGSTNVATLIGVPMTTVHSWVRKNSIPQWRRPQLAKLVKRNGVPMPDKFEDAAA